MVEEVVVDVSSEEEEKVEVVDDVSSCDVLVSCKRRSDPVTSRARETDMVSTAIRNRTSSVFILPAR